MKHITIKLVAVCIALGTGGFISCTQTEKEKYEGNKRNDTADTRHHPGMDK